MKAFYKLVVIVFLWTNFQSTSAQNIFLNSGLDATLDSWNEIISPDNSATIEINNAQSYLGGGCARITLNQLGALGGLAQAATIIPGKHYLLSCAVKTDNLDGIALPYFNLGNTQLELEYGIIPSQQNTDWIVRESRFICPAQVSNITFFLFCQGNSGIAYFDEISLTELPSQPASTFTIDVNTNEGFINPLMHVNAGPLHAQSTIDLTEKFQESHISFVRTHDFYGPCDLHTIFPNFAADENDPLSYDFASSDEMITAIIQSGAKVLFRLGESYELNPIHNNPSTDNDKAATICENIVKHYNDGWNNGFNYDIEHWEIWNEPDLQQFWNGTVEEYISFYSAVANKLRTYDPTLKIGGPAVSSPISGWFIEPFLEAVSTNNLPMDFFSYHFYYMSNPYGFVEADQSMLEKLTQYGLQDAERYITEWNNYTYSPNGGINVWRNDPFNAASTAASLIYLQETNLDAAFRYRADEFYFGMFACSIEQHRWRSVRIGVTFWKKHRQRFDECSYCQLQFKRQWLYY